MEGGVALTYSLIYEFLRKQDQTKAADAVKKAARNIIILKDDLGFEGPHLDEIIKQWIDLQDAGSSSESDSSDDSSDDSSSSSSSSSSESTSSSDESESSSSESDSDSEEATQANTKVPVMQSCAERDTSVTLSSDAKVPEVKSGPPPKKSSIEESSGSDSDSDSSSDSSSDKKIVAKVAPNKDGGSSNSESSSSGSESSSSSSESSDSESTSSSSESESEAETTRTSIKKSTKDNIVSSKSRSVDVSSIPKEETQVAKKRKTSESGAAVVTAVAVIPPGDHVQKSLKNKDIQRDGNSKPHRNANERFSRIKPQTIPPEQLLDNGYEAKGGVTDDYGARAHRDLIVTRGAGFRKEKNKKKRGSYRGGEITLQTHSIKFTD